MKHLPIDAIKNNYRASSYDPRFTADFGSMIDVSEGQMLYHLASEYYLGLGEIVELGTFAGASSAVLADGLKHNKNLPQELCQQRLHCYDSYVYQNNPMDRFFIKSRWAELVKSKKDGDSFLDIFDANLAPWAEFLQREAGDITQTQWCRKPIEILFIDLAFRAPMFSKIVAEFFPCLMPGHSVVAHQDYGYVYPWLIYGMEYLDCFRLVDYGVSSTALFALESPLPQNKLTDLIENRLSISDKLALLDRALTRLDGQSLLNAKASRAVFLAYAQGLDAANAELAALAAIDPENRLTQSRLDGARALIEINIGKSAYL